MDAIHRKIFDILSATIGSTFLVVQVLVLVVFSLYSDFRSEISYRIMFSLGVTDGTQLFVFSYSGILKLLRMSPSAWTEKALGAVLFSSSFVVYLQQIFLAIDRIFAFSSARNYEFESRVTRTMTFLCAVSFVASIIVFAIDPSLFVYDIATGFWMYVESHDDFTRCIALIDRVTSHGGCFAILIAYFCIVFLLFKRRTIITNKSEKRQRQKLKAFNAELRILAICTSRFIIDVLVIAFVYHSDTLLPRGKQSLALFIGNIFWLAACTVGSFTTLSFNTIVQKRFLLLVRCRVQDDDSARRRMSSVFVISPKNPHNTTSVASLSKRLSLGDHLDALRPYAAGVAWQRAKRNSII